jgi:hypothetical protein
VRVLGLSAGGESPEDLAPVVNNMLAYDGTLQQHKRATLSPKVQAAQHACANVCSSVDVRNGQLMFHVLYNTLLL